MVRRAIGTISGAMKRWMLAVAVGLALSMVAHAAMAAACAQRADLVAFLAKEFKEAPVALGVDANGNLVEVLSSGSGSTWSIIVTRPSGMSCLVASGADWQVLKAAEEDGPQV